MTNILWGVLLISISPKFKESCSHRGCRELLDVGTKRGVGMSSNIRYVEEPLVKRTAKTAQTSDSSDLPQSSLSAAECWARRTTWVLVIVMSLWDIAVTFDKPFALITARLF